jgi:hypothetical protein
MQNRTVRKYLLSCLCLCAALGAQAQAQTVPAAQAAQPAPARVAPAATTTQPLQTQQAPAQQPAPRGSAAQLGPLDGSLLSFDFGVATGYSLNDKKPTVGQSFGLGIMMSDNLAVGFTSTSIGATPISYQMFRLGYSFTPLIGMDIYLGTDGNAAAGLDAFIRLARSRSDAGLYSSLKVRLGYFLDLTNGPAKGDVALTIGSSVGI